MADRLRELAAAIEDDGIPQGLTEGFVLVLLTEGEPAVAWSAPSTTHLANAQTALGVALEARRNGVVRQCVLRRPEAAAHPSRGLPPPPEGARIIPFAPRRAHPRDPDAHHGVAH